jgi:site-specific recombinase XerD
VSVPLIGVPKKRTLRRLQRNGPTSLYVFVSGRGTPVSVADYQRVVGRIVAAAGFPFLIHSHMLRHSCGYRFADDGQGTRAIEDYLDHRAIVSTQRYTALSPHRLNKSCATGHSLERPSAGKYRGKACVLE